MGKRYVMFGIDLGDPLDLSVIGDALPRGARQIKSREDSKPQPAAQQQGGSRPVTEDGRRDRRNDSGKDAHTRDNKWR